MALTGRQGLNLLGVTSDTVPAAHYNPDVKARAALAKVTAQLLGGEGVYVGGAAVVGDLTGGGTLYPAVTMIVYDDSGEAWYFRTTGTTAIQFLDTSGACSLYAVVQQIAALTPAGAVGGAANVLFVSQLTATAAPAHSLKLGAGNVTASAFTTFVPAAGATPSAVAVDPGGIQAGSQIIAEGDSWTAGNGLAANEFWPTVLMTLPSFLNKGTLNNFASSGNTVANVAARYAGSVYPLRPAGGSHSYLLVLAGTNDLHNGDSGATVYAALAAYWTTAVADGFEVWAFTIPERGNWSPAVRIQAQECNRLIRESTVWTRLVDLAPLFTDPSDTTIYQGDTIHPTAVGAGKIARLVDEMGSHVSTPTRSMGHTLSIGRLFAAYRVGIGNILPTEALDVTGNVLASGSLAAASAKLKSGSFWATLTAASLAADRALTIPDPLAAANFVLTEGALQTINSRLNFSKQLTLGITNVTANATKLSFDGSGDSVSIGVNGVPEINSAAAFTISFWATFDDVTKATDGLFSKSVGSTNRVLIRAAADDFRVYINNGASNTYGHFTLSSVAANNELHHFAIVYDGAQATDALRLLVYVDGVAQTLAYLAAIPATTGDLSTATAILSDTGTSSHQGYLSDFRVYSTALSAANVLLVEAGDYAVAGMVHRWKMNDGTGATTCADTGTNPQAGTITGATWANLPMAGLGVDVPQAGFDLGANLGARYGIKAGIAKLFLSAAGVWKMLASLIVGTDLTVNGNTQLGDASTDTVTCTARLLVRSVTDAGPMTATGGTQREVVFNTSDSKFYGCTVTHASAATWVAFN